MAKSQLFTGGGAEDVSYVNIRDKMPEARRHCEELWELFEPYADREFLIEIKKNFDARYWEMYLAVFLMKTGFEVLAPKPGPDIGIKYKGCRIWFEATCPERGAIDNPDRVPEFKATPIGEEPIFQNVPQEEILLRYLNALSGKRDQYVSWRDKGVVTPEDSLVIAINPRRLKRDFIDSDPPRILQAAYAVGPPFVVIDSQTAQPIEGGYQFRDKIRRRGGNEVSAGVFLLNDYAGFSGLLCSRVDAANHPNEMGSDFQLVENRKAKAPLPDTFRLKGVFFRIDPIANGYVAVPEAH